MPAEAEAFLAENPDIEAFDIVLHDSNGIGRGKIIRRHELMSVFTNGRFMPISILGLDICGEDVHETGLIWDHGDGDLRTWPIPGTPRSSAAISVIQAWPIPGLAPARIPGAAPGNMTVRVFLTNPPWPNARASSSNPGSTLLTALKAAK